MKIALFSLIVIFSLQLNECGSQIISEPCYTDREVAEEIADVKVECMKIGEDFFFSIKSESKRYMVCNQDAAELEEHKAYLISGKCYEIKPNERWPGTPFQLTKIKNL